MRNIELDDRQLVIGLRMTTAEHNSDNPFAVAVGKASGRRSGKTSYVLCHQPKSFDWRLRKARTHPLGALSNALLVQVCERLNQYFGIGRYGVIAGRVSVCVDYSRAKGDDAWYFYIGDAF
jgi:mRNA-degrading endonuclease toxin of MazEF toxin-antitoxin module